MVICVKCKKQMELETENVEACFNLNYCFNGDIFKCPDCDCKTILTKEYHRIDTTQKHPDILYPNGKYVIMSQRDIKHFNGKNLITPEKTQKSADNTNEKSDEYISVKEACALLNVCRARVYQLIQKKKLKAHQVKRTWYITKDSVTERATQQNTEYYQKFNKLLEQQKK